jgi:hypothetical protein
VPAIVDGWRTAMAACDDRFFQSCQGLVQRSVSPMSIPAFTAVPAFTSSTNCARPCDMYVGQRSGGQREGTAAEMDVMRRSASANMMSREMHILTIQKLSGYAASTIHNMP